ncbi:uncharacterized protein VICG_01811 [Vittaforma corneae ATCC 50505]|uniref:Uncharacterized protein n=1 Tax=Vittaforma corneae (strain ATCC 50505) TaxID=993615 RepID=L2GLG4_VITCO|nr:uncharacterized protein VICG_01811 [Vittaforma corneae ATCC 50505]ELA41112.1 hypothetical protein VICG_01811 [Vittaforma corneae ATCC 50505]
MVIKLEVSLQSYFDAETGECNTMPNLNRLTLHGNPISKIDARIEKVFPNKFMEIRLNNLRLCHPLSNMKDELKKARIQPIEPDRSISIGCHELVKLVFNTDLKYLYLLISSSTFIFCTNVL